MVGLLTHPCSAAAPPSHATAAISDADLESVESLLASNLASGDALFVEDVANISLYLSGASSSEVAAQKLLGAMDRLTTGFEASSAADDSRYAEALRTALDNLSNLLLAERPLRLNALAASRWTTEDAAVDLSELFGVLIDRAGLLELHRRIQKFARPAGRGSDTVSPDDLVESRTSVTAAFVAFLAANKLDEPRLFGDAVSDVRLEVPDALSVWMRGIVYGDLAHGINKLGSVKGINPGYLSALRRQVAWLNELAAIERSAAEPAPARPSPAQGSSGPGLTPHLEMAGDVTSRSPAVPISSSQIREPSGSLTAHPPVHLPPAGAEAAPAPNAKPSVTPRTGWMAPGDGSPPAGVQYPNKNAGDVDHGRGEELPPVISLPSPLPLSKTRAFDISSVRGRTGVVVDWNGALGTQFELLSNPPPDTDAQRQVFQFIPSPDDVSRQVTVQPTPPGSYIFVPYTNEYIQDFAAETGPFEIRVRPNEITVIASRVATISLRLGDLAGGAQWQVLEEDGRTPVLKDCGPWRVVAGGTDSHSFCVGRYVVKIWKRSDDGRSWLAPTATEINARAGRTLTFTLSSTGVEFQWKDTKGISLADSSLHSLAR